MAENNTLVPSSESSQIERAVFAWINTCTTKPVSRIDFEHLADDCHGMCFSTIQGAYYVRRYIDGGYRAQYQFKIIYRSQPTGNDERLKANEVLNEIGAWAETAAKPSIGDNRTVISVERNTAAGVFQMYADGSQDNQIILTLTYEVI